MLSQADFTTIAHILRCARSPDNLAEFDAWVSSCTTLEQFWPGVTNFASYSEIVNDVFDYVIHEVKSLEQFCGVTIEARISIMDDVQSATA